MNCPHLKESPYHTSLVAKKLLSCKANGLLYVPSISELDVYCRHIRHRSCPFYLDFKDQRDASVEKKAV